MEPNSSGKFIVGVDVGGTNNRGALVSRDGKILGEARNDTRAPEGPGAVVEQVRRTIEQCIEKGGAAKADVCGIGIGFPGRITEDGKVLWSPNFPGIEDYGVAEAISAATELPVWMGNDVNVASLGEYRFGAGRGVGSLVMLTLGTGIGGGIIINRQVWTGFNAGGAEIGHMVVNPNGRRCGCGNHGCLEAMAQRDAIIDRAVQKFQTGRSSLLAERVQFQADKVTPALISQCASEGDEVCLETLAETGYWVGMGIANMINILNPEMVIVGGGISQAGDPLWEPMLRTVRSNAIYESWEICRIVPAELGDDAGIMGGVSLVMQAMGES